MVAMTTALLIGAPSLVATRPEITSGRSTGGCCGAVLIAADGAGADAPETGVRAVCALPTHATVSDSRATSGTETAGIRNGAARMDDLLAGA